MYLNHGKFFIIFLTNLDLQFSSNFLALQVKVYCHLLISLLCHSTSVHSSNMITFTHQLSPFIITFPFSYVFSHSTPTQSTI